MIDVYEQLMGAVVEDNVEEVQRLIENGIDLNSRCDQGASALFGAILYGNPSIIRLMLSIVPILIFWPMNQPQVSTPRSHWTWLCKPVF